MKKLLLISLLFISMACKEKKQFPRWEEVCLISHTETVMIPSYINNQLYMMPSSEVVCDKKALACVFPPDWSGDKACPETKQERK